MDLEIDVSNKCNIRCKMCYFSFDQAFYAKPAYLSPNAFTALAEGILPHARAVMLSLGSEPLSSPHFVSILRLAARHHVPELGFYTNGLLMNDRIIEAIIEHDVTMVSVSIDGATRPSNRFDGAPPSISCSATCAGSCDDARRPAACSPGCASASS